MNARREALTREKEDLLACSALGRIRLRRQVNGVRDSFRWRRFATAAVVSPATHRVAFGLAVSWIGVQRSARMLRLARRVVAYAKLAASISESLRAR
ncbi:MAG: hypothetical protein WA190_15785 [Usitatibacter sp.]